MFALILASLVVLTVYVILLRKRKSSIPFPPGPKPKLIVGNAFDLPKGKPWLGHMEISKQFNSGVIHFSAMGTHIIVINRMEDAVALLDKRSALYSSRPILATRKMHRAYNYWTHEWRQHRRIFQESLKKDSIPSYDNLYMDKVHLMLAQFLRDPADFLVHCKALSASISLEATFGYELQSQKHNPIVEMGDILTKGITELNLPGRTIIQLFTFLAHIPPWVPGAATQIFAAYLKQIAKQYLDIPYEYVKRGLATGTAKSCLLTTVLQNNPTRREGPYEEKVIKDAMATLYPAGGETIQSALTIFIFVMVLHPQQQGMAQDEIDRIVGTDRLPTFEDRSHLPYVEALFREALRWQPVLPLNVAHATIRDDVYKGFLIPKNAAILANIWAISRNEDVYQDPNSFMPERFFNEDGTLNDDTVDYAFGFGRRICAGRHVADSVIGKAKDEAGNEIDVDPAAFSDAFVSFPLPFKCFIAPRSLQAEKLVRAAAESS